MQDIRFRVYRKNLTRVITQKVGKMEYVCTWWGTLLTGIITAALGIAGGVSVVMLYKKAISPAFGVAGRAIERLDFPVPEIAVISWETQEKIDNFFGVVFTYGCIMMAAASIGAILYVLGDTVAKNLCGG